MQFGDFEALLQEIAHDRVGEKLHAAIRLVNDEPFAGSQQLVGNHQRADRVVAGPPAGKTLLTERNKRHLKFTAATD